jgi:hypothetical protein
MRKPRLLVALAVALAVAILIVGCSGGNDDSPVNPNADLYKSYLYMTESFSGKVYAYDPATHAASGISLASVSRNATGELAFYRGIGYACVGSGTDAGVYYFAPSASNPAFTKIPGTVCAQYCAFASATKAYVSVFDYATAADGIYTFNPSAPQSGISAAPITGTAGDGYQEIIVAPDGYLYAANNADGTVLRIDTAADTIIATINASAGGTTGLVAGTFDGAAGVFVANTAGSVDFVASSAPDGSDAAVVISGSIYPARILQLPNGNLIATGYDPSYANHTYLVDFSGDDPVSSEILCGGASFGGLDIAYKDGYAYVPAAPYNADEYWFESSLFVFDSSGISAAFSPVEVMTWENVEMVSNIAFYED